MIDKIIKALKDEANADVKIKEAKEMFSAGWEAMCDGTVVNYNGNQVAVKDGNSIIVYRMKDFRINMGKLIGDIECKLKAIEVPDAKKESYLAQAIVAKYYTIPGR
jgi:hypothetical protein